MSPPNASDMKVFVPAMNFSQSVEFYEGMGGTSIGELMTIVLLSWSLPTAVATSRTTTTKTGRTIL